MVGFHSPIGGLVTYDAGRRAREVEACFFAVVEQENYYAGVLTGMAR